MKKLFQIGAIFCVLAAQSLYAAESAEAANPAPAPAAQVADGEGCCPADHPACDQPTGDCWCLYVHYEPCYYTTQRCVEEKIPCTKRCCRKVPKYYQVEKCRWVPEKYCETQCCYVDEYYDVPDCKCCTKVVCDQHCRYVPKYYWKHVCQQAGCTTPCPTGY